MTQNEEIHIAAAAPAAQTETPASLRFAPYFQPQPAPKRLAAKLAAIMGALHRVPKNGVNQHFHYKYVTESDLADALRSELASRGVVILPSVRSLEREELKTSGGAASFVTVWMEFTFIDSESGESWTSVIPGQASDSLDKAVYKAMTGAQKYLQLKTFLVSSGDDPEEDAEQERVAAAPSKGAIRPKAAAQPYRGHGDEGRWPPPEWDDDAPPLRPAEAPANGVAPRTVRGVLTAVERKAKKDGNPMIVVRVAGMVLYNFDPLLDHLLEGCAGKPRVIEYEEKQRDGKTFRTITDVKEGQ